MSSLLVVLDPTKRFSNRVEDYVRYRPGYPRKLTQELTDRIGLKRTWNIADVGSGTGKLTEIFLGFGCSVVGVEPNDEMRQAGEIHLKRFENFWSTNGTAEKTGLPVDSVDLVTAGQAFHWFNRDKARMEFLRILIPDGWVALVWNERDAQESVFLREYDELLKSIPAYSGHHHGMEVDSEIEGFFARDFIHFSMENLQSFNWEGLYGRAMSSSYVPKLGESGHPEFTKDLQDLFERHESQGEVHFPMKTEVYLGRL